jgi:hypothetical protein
LAAAGNIGGTKPLAYAWVFSDSLVAYELAFGIANWARLGAWNRNNLSLPQHQGEHEVGEIEQRELDGHRAEIIADVAKLVEKYRAIFDWDVPDIDQYAADKLILVEMRKALDDVEKTLLNQDRRVWDCNQLDSGARHPPSGSERNSRLNKYSDRGEERTR